MVKGFAGASVTVVYGSTEAEPISHADAAEIAKDDLTHGLPVGGVDSAAQVAIVSYCDSAWPVKREASFSESWLDEGEVGEIVVAGPHVVQEYFNNKSALSQNKILVGNQLWHRTGDAGRLIGRQLWLFGRCKQVLLIDGRAVYPFVVEGLLAQAAEVNQLALVQANGQPLLCFAGNQAAEARLRAALPPFGLTSVPVRRMKRLPLDPRHHGKVDYAALLKQLGHLSDVAS